MTIIFLLRAWIENAQLVRDLPKFSRPVPKSGAVRAPTPGTFISPPLTNIMTAPPPTTASSGAAEAHRQTRYKSPPGATDVILVRWVGDQGRKGEQNDL